MKVEKFLKRIGFKGTPKVDYETLTRLQTNFLLSVPFENIDIHYGPKKITLDVEAFYDKIVERGRGGFCFECNGLMYAMLREMGFHTELFSARMCVPHPTDQPEFGHIFLRVVMDRGYLVDVGNGQSFRTPLYEDGGNDAWIPEGFWFRIGPHISGRTLYTRSRDARWTPRFNYDPIARALPQFAEMCRWHQTNPQSTFVKGPLATLALPDGRIFVTRNRFTENRFGKTTETPIASEAEFLECLKTRFNIIPDVQ